MQPVDVLLRTWGGLDGTAPVAAEIEGQVLLEALAAVEFRETHRPHHRVVPELAELVLHGGIDEIEVGHQGAVTGLIDHPLEEAAHEAGVLRHRVGLLGAFTQLGSKGDGHE
jgi:hypothetical protein